MDAISKARGDYMEHIQNSNGSLQNGVPHHHHHHHHSHDDRKDTLATETAPDSPPVHRHHRGRGRRSSLTSTSSMGSYCDLGTIPEDGPKKRYTTDGGNLLSVIYSVVLIVFGTAFPIRDALQQVWLTTYVEAVFLVYLYAVSFFFILFVEIYVIRMDRKYGHERKKEKDKPQILVKDKNRDTQSIYDTVNGKFMAVDTATLAKRKQSMVEAASGVEIFILEAPSEEPKPHHTSLYVRFGAVIFGLGNMVYDGLLLRQIQINADHDVNCMTTTFVWPYYLNLVFLLAQTYFIFKQQQIHIAFVKPLARLGFMHLFATNVCVWIRTVIRETLDSFLHHSAGDHSGGGGDHGEDQGAGDHGDSSVSDHGVATADTSHYVSGGRVYNLTSSSGDHYGEAIVGGGMYNATGGGYNVTDMLCNIDKDILLQASPYLFPCVLEYSLLCAAVMFSMCGDVGMLSASDYEMRPKNTEEKDKALVDRAETAFRTVINFHKSHKGMFAGLMVIAATVVSIVLFFAYVDDTRDSSRIIYHSTIIGLYSLVVLATIMAFVQLHKLKFNRKMSSSVDDVMLGIAMSGFSLFQILKIIPLVGALTTAEEQVRISDILTLVECILALIVAVQQTWFLIDGMRRFSKNEEQHINKPGRGAVMFLLLTNVALWLFRTFHMKEVEVDGNLEELEYGYLAWQLILHALVPLLIFYHFHCSACLAHIWSEAYLEPPPEPEINKHLRNDSDEDSDGDLPQNQLKPQTVVQGPKRKHKTHRLSPLPTVSGSIDSSASIDPSWDERYRMPEDSQDSNIHESPPLSKKYPASPVFSHQSSAPSETPETDLELAETPVTKRKRMKSSLKAHSSSRSSSVKWKDLERKVKEEGVDPATVEALDLAWDEEPDLLNKKDNLVDDATQTSSDLPQPTDEDHEEPIHDNTRDLIAQQENERDSIMQQENKTDSSSQVKNQENSNQQLKRETDPQENDSQPETETRNFSNLHQQPYSHPGPLHEQDSLLHQQQQEGVNPTPEPERDLSKENGSQPQPQEADHLKDLIFQEKDNSEENETDRTGSIQTPVTPPVPEISEEPHGQDWDNGDIEASIVDWQYNKLKPYLRLQFIENGEETV